MKNLAGVIVCCAMVCGACAGIPLLSPSPEEVRQDKYFSGIHKYPSQSLRQMQRQFEQYKTRCGVDLELTESPTFELTSEREATVVAHTEDGQAALILLEQIDDNVLAHTWVRNTRLAEYLTTALEGGACGAGR